MPKTKELLEVGVAKTKPEEEKFYERFSIIQTNAVLLLVLSATFLTTGMINYAQVLDNLQFLNFLEKWLVFVVLSIALLILSVIAIVLAGVLNVLKYKRLANTFGFWVFLVGAIFFFSTMISLIIFLLV